MMASIFCSFFPISPDVISPPETVLVAFSNALLTRLILSSLGYQVGLQTSLPHAPLAAVVDTGVRADSPLRMWASILKGAAKMPWSKIARVIPWEKIRWPVFKKTDPSAPTLKGLSDRLDVVEQEVKRTAEASQQIAEETSETVEALSSATEILASRLLWALILGGTALVISIISLILLLVRV